MDPSSWKTFLGIYFNEESWAVVPKVWMSLERGRFIVYWPNDGSVANLASSLCPPDKKLWGAWPVDKVAETSGKQNLFFY